MRKNYSFRFGEDTIAALDERVAELDRSRNELVERYVREGLRMDRHPPIVFVEGAAGRRPVLAGTRISVADVVETARELGNSADSAAEYLSLPLWKVQAALRYYADYRDEVDAWIERNGRYAEREEEMSRAARAAPA
jgi:uncharacterized protein (DUF433 family)